MKIYLRLEGVVGDIFSEYYSQYVYIHSSSLPQLKKSNLYSFYCVYHYIRDYIDRIRCRPETYKNMQLCDDISDAILEMKKEDWDVTIFTDLICKPEKQEWLDKYFPNVTILWSTPPQDGIIIDTQFGEKPKDIIFIPYLASQSHDKRYIYTWNSDWKDVINNLIILTKSC